MTKWAGVIIAWCSVVFLMYWFGVRNLNLIGGESFWIVFVGILLLSSFFSSSETSLTTIQANQGPLADWMSSRTDEFRKNERGKWPYTIDKYRYDSVDVLTGENFSKTLALILVMNNLVNIGGVTFLALFVREAPSKDVFITVMTVIPILLLGEIAAKSMAERASILVALWVSVPIHWLSKFGLGTLAQGLERPITFLLRKLFRIR